MLNDSCIISNGISSVRGRAWVCHDGAAASGTLQRLTGRVEVLVEVTNFHHDVRGHNWHRKLQLHFRLTLKHTQVLLSLPGSQVVCTNN